MTAPPGSGPTWARRAFVAFLSFATVALLVSMIGDGDDGGDGGGDAAEDASVAERRPTETTTTLRVPTPEEPLRILVVGDSLVGWIAPALEAELAGEPYELVDDWKGSSGLVRTDFFDWPARVAEDVAAHDPEVVVAGFGGNDAQNLLVDGELLERGTPAWQAEYQRRVASVLDAIEGPGRTVYWIELPLTELPGLEAVRPAITDAVRAEAEERPWVHVVDTLEVLTPDGTYTVFVPGPDGEPLRVRADDGVHPSVGGGQLIVASFIDDLRAERGLDG